VFASFEALRAACGDDLGCSSWLAVDQSRIDFFAATTGDNAWIHVDVERAAAGPFGRTIAHGPLTLSLVTRLAGEVIHVGGLSLALHYGYDKVRFLAPVPVGSRIRAHVWLRAVDGDAAGTKAHYHVDVEVDGDVRPACSVDLIYFYAFTTG
jgi:acyl dehydratase